MEQTTTSTIRLNLLQKTFSAPQTTETAVKEFQAACKELVIFTSEILRREHYDPKNLLFRYRISELVKNVLKAYQCLDIEAPENTTNLWGESTRPGIDLITAKLVKYSSNLYAVAHAYPETCLESNMDYDLRQYLMFLHAYCETKQTDLMQIVAWGV